jgi:hypothetical protein
MMFLQNLSALFLPNKRSGLSLAVSTLASHDQTDKLDTLKAVNVLVEYKTKVHDFTDEIVEFWALPKQIMERYQFDNVEQLNEWLDTLS